MRHEATKVAANDAVPCSALPLIELWSDQSPDSYNASICTHLALDVLCNVLGVCVSCMLALRSAFTHFLDRVLLHSLLCCNS